MNNNTHDPDYKKKRITLLRGALQKYEYQLNNTQSVKVMNSSLEKIHAIAKEIKSLEAKPHQANKSLSHSGEYANENEPPANQKENARRLVKEAKESAKAARKVARKAKNYENKSINTKSERALPAKAKTIARWGKEVARQERIRANLFAKSAETTLKLATRQLNSSGTTPLNQTRSPRLFDGTVKHQTATTKSKRFTKK